MAEKFFKRIENIVTSNFSFSHSAFKRLILQSRENQGFFWEKVNGQFSTCQGTGFSKESLPDDKILDWSKLKQITDAMLKCIKMKNKCHIEWKTL